MDQFRQVGEALGGIRSLMVLKEDIQINRKQCLLLYDIFNLAYDTISDEIRQNLRLEEKNIKWKALENPLKELHRIFKEGESYIKSCLEIKDWWGKAIAFHQNRECVELHIHNLLFCFSIVVDAIESAGEIACVDQDDMQKRRILLMKKYEGDWNDPKLFQWRYGKEYLVSREICNRLESSWREDRWILLETIKEKKNSTVVPNHSKNEQRLAELMIHKLNGNEPNGKLFPGSTLTATKDYTVKRRLGSGGSHCKEIQWFGESFALKNFYGEVNEDLRSEISKVLSLSHPNILQYHCIFHDEDKKEGYLVMEAMNKSLSTFVKENSGPRKRITISLPSAVDIMLQVARGMEYLHSQKIYHGDLNPSNVLLKPRHPASEGYFYAKINGYRLTNSMKYNSKRNVAANQNTEEPIIWYAPEVLNEMERGSKKVIHKYTEKADVYSYGMLCFEILTGKVPFEEVHLQDDKTGRNIRAGERPLFPFTTPKFLVTLTRKCWQAESSNRPSFSAICRILRHIKKCLVINPDLGQPESAPPIVDYCDIEMGYSTLFPAGWKLDFAPISQVPFQMFAYRLVEKEKVSANLNKVWDLARDGQSGWGPSSMDGGNNGGAGEDSFFKATDRRSVCSESPTTKVLSKPKDQRSVCSDTPWRRVLSMTAVENKLACSEFSWRKINDNSSTVGSKIERRNSFAGPAMVDQTSEGGDAVERNESDLLIPGENSHVENYPPSENNIETGEKNVVGEESKSQKGTLSRALSEAKFSSFGDKKKFRLSRTMSDLNIGSSPNIKKKDQMMPSTSDSMGSSAIFEIPEKKPLLSSKETEKKPTYYESGDKKLLIKRKKLDSSLG
ncbi:uncharacterized protein LOC124928836 [Impatiens glandulifera]|uniref:uncharacterized protein LOC124928836 n=1 Tax=Impatiens glandulifera TaxID=253017 RepID=UPI001FB14A9F|nr:uncharacterized protein LOC124928836 [Impatiens glandulifera]